METKQYLKKRVDLLEQEVQSLKDQLNDKKPKKLQLNPRFSFN